MKKMIFGAVAGLILAGCTSDNGTVTIRLPKDFTEKTLVVRHLTLENIFNAKQQDDLNVIYDTLDVKDGVAKLEIDRAGAAWYAIEPPMMTRSEPEFYAVPDEKLEITISAFEPLEYTVAGSQLMEDITALAAATKPVQQEFYELMNSNDSVTKEQVQTNNDRYDAVIKKFVAEHPKSPAVPYAILDLGADDFKAIYDNMTPEARTSILMPYADNINRQVEEMIKERDAENTRKAEVAAGTIEAPNFTLPDLTGKKITLTDFRGKWVVLDFWGSWCGWCIKGFPALKEAYKKYGDKIVVIGIGCNEPEADWRAGVKKHELPWLNLYNGNDNTLYTAYNIEGFPTKVIINPEGHIVDITTGEDPEFFTRLANFIK